MRDYLNILKSFENLRDVPEAELNWLLAHGEIRRFSEGEYLFHTGDPIENLCLILEGHLSLRLEQMGQFKELTAIEAPGMVGLLPYSRAGKAQSAGIFSEEAIVLIVPGKHFGEMISHQHKLVAGLVHQMLDRVRQFTEQTHQFEKLLAMGKLAAGLAHELNNPAAAILSSSRVLKKHLKNAPRQMTALFDLQLSAPEFQAVSEFLTRRATTSPDRGGKGDKRIPKASLVAWMNAHHVQHVDEKAVLLADFSFSDEDLALLAKKVDSSKLEGVLGWVCDHLVTEKLTGEIGEAADRIGKLVQSVKSFTRMGPAGDPQPAFIPDGLRSTLTLLNHKIKAKRIEVKLTFPPDFPSVPQYPGELNQVWTNLIDNAADALPPGGKLFISGAVVGERVEVEIRDNGPGIPPEIRERIFDLFFTTKPVGEGTGLGLDIVQKIVKHHHGDIRVASQPGNTAFTVSLPREIPA